MKLEMNVMPTPGKPNEITILEGKALEQKPANVIRIDGDINSVATYIQRRFTAIAEQPKPGGNLQIIDTNRALIIVDKQKQTISLDVDPQDYYGPIVTGRLEESEELKPFSINRNTTFTKEQLVKLLRFSRLLFSDSDKHAGLLLAYQSFSAKAYIDLMQEADTRGNKNNTFKKSVETNIPTDFVMTVPIFKGQPKETFRVEICLDVTEGSARFWFESVELAELIQTRVDEIMQKQLENCGDFVVIYK
jgi:hypothetical protein